MMLAPLSPDTQAYMDRQDVDSFIMEWNIPAAHRFQWDELVRKGYVVPHTKQTVSNEGKPGELHGYVFAQELRSALDDQMKMEPNF